MDSPRERNQRFDELFRRIQFTCKARYNAARRLSRYHLFTQITPAFMSIGLVIIPLAKILGFNRGYTESYIELMQIVFAVLLLAYSLLLGMGNYSARAEKAHHCGMTLGKLARKIFPYRSVKDSSDLDEDYEKMCTEYYECLEKHENHKHIDFLVAKYDLLDAGGKLDLWVMSQRVGLWVNMVCRELFELSHFILSLLALGAWIWYMVRHAAS